jgi:hypothetical protein
MADEQTELVDEALRWLSARLPSSWSAGRTQRTFVAAGGQETRELDAAIDIRGTNGITTTFAVEARDAFEPRDVERLLPGLARSLRSLAGYIPILVVAPWLSPRTQELLEREEINFIDLTGNARIALENPALYLRTQGAVRNPAPRPRGAVRVRGAKAARLVRTLADVRPPYGVRELAQAAGINPGYASQLIDALDREALVERERRGAVVDVDVDGLLRRWAESYDVFATNKAEAYLSPAGPAAALDQLRTTRFADEAVITGSFAAVRHAPVAAPALLCLYVARPAQVAEELNLLPTDSGANVVLLRPFDDVVSWSVERDDGLTYAAASQVAVDCLTGNGRMPAEGEAMLLWMKRDDSWRRPGLATSA